MIPALPRTAAYAHCRRLVKSSRPDEYAVMQLMPAPLRPACWAMYAAAVTTDHLVDAPDGPGAAGAASGAADPADALRRWVDALHAELPDGASADPVRHALIDTITAWQLDVMALTPVFSALREDAAGSRTRTWREWSLRAQAENTPWSTWCLTLLARAGIRTSVEQRHLETFPLFLDGLYLTDTLTDLAEDLGHGILTLPAEALARHGVAEEELFARRWTPGVEALIAELTALAHERLDQPGLREGLHPGLAELLRTTTELFGARVRAARRLGPALLHRTAALSPASRQRVLLPGRLRTARAWRRVPFTTGPAPVSVSVPAQASASAPDPVPAAVPAPAAPPLPPRPHPSGARPPAIPAERLPRHVGVIMDGNGRWAAERGLPRSEGHLAGAEATRDVVHGALEAGLSHLTLYAFSTENWARNAEEIARLFRTIHDTLRDEDIRARDIRLCWAGSPEGLPDDLVETLRDSVRDSRHRTGLTLTLCVNYGGRSELAQAAAALARAAVAGEVDPRRIDEAALAARLPEPRLPGVDLLWRPGGEHRISNFLPWHLTYGELHFTDDLWPDIDRRDLWQALDVYARRQRRHGSTPGSPAPVAVTGPFPGP